MIFSEKIVDHLTGKEFTSGLRVKIRSTKYLPKSRQEIILDQVRNKSVIHLGCSDHMEIIDTKIEENRWLHKLLTDECSKCIGIDIDRESIKYLIDKLGYSNVVAGDILTDKIEPLETSSWDFVVMGELIEHLDNPVDFLSKFREKFTGKVDKFIITVPNIMNKRAMRLMETYQEHTNSDHRFWFTPYTISKIITRAGMIPEEIYYGNRIILTNKELAIRKFRRLFSLDVKYPFYYFNSIIVAGRVN